MIVSVRALARVLKKTTPATYLESDPNSIDINTTVTAVGIAIAITATRAASGPIWKMGASKATNATAKAGDNTNR